jgi:hypothetical protein
MGAVLSMGNSSAETKELAVTIFHECLATLEPRLGDIPQELRRRSRREKHF